MVLFLLGLPTVHCLSMPWRCFLLRMYDFRPNYGTMGWGYTLQLNNPKASHHNSRKLVVMIRDNQPPSYCKANHQICFKNGQSHHGSPNSIIYRQKVEQSLVANTWQGSAQSLWMGRLRDKMLRNICRPLPISGDPRTAAQKMYRFSIKRGQRVFSSSKLIPLRALVRKKLLKHSRSRHWLSSFQDSRWALDAALEPLMSIAGLIQPVGTTTIYPYHHHYSSHY